MEIRASLLYLLLMFCMAVVGASPNLDVIKSYPNLSQLAQAINDTGFDSLWMLTTNAQVFMAPNNSAFDAFVSDWRNKGLDITQFTDLPTELQLQILEYHFTFDDWSPYHICKYTKTAVDDPDTKSGTWNRIGPPYRPVGPGDVTGTIYAYPVAGLRSLPPEYHFCFHWDSRHLEVPTEKMAIQIVDEYTDSSSNFLLSESQYHGSFLIHFLSEVLIPGSAMNTLEQMIGNSMELGWGPTNTTDSVV